MADTKIERATKVWNPVTGCTKVGQGCKHCYAERMHKRLAANPKTPEYHGREFGDVVCHEDRLYQPFHWKKPQTVFVNSMGDLFHKDVPDAFLEEVVRVMGFAHWHTFIVLTKRPERLKAYCEDRHGVPRNIIWGVSCSTQPEANLWIPMLLQTPHLACRVVSLEPLLGPVDVSQWLGRNILPSQHGLSNWPLDGLDWVIVGGESGPGARPMHPDWVRGLRDQCQSAGVAFFFKQWGEWGPSEYQSHTVFSEDDAGKLMRMETIFTTGPKRDLGEVKYYCVPSGYDGQVMGFTTMSRVGKHRAGRLLDGVVHDGRPGCNAQEMLVGSVEGV